MKKSFLLHSIFLILFMLGIAVLYLLMNGLFKTNFDFLILSFFVALCMIVPFIILTVFRHYRNNLIRRRIILQNKQKYDILSKNGALLEIELNESSLILKPLTPKNNTDVEYIKETLGLSICDVFKPKQYEHDSCLVTIKYVINNIVYYKTFPLPFSEKNALILLCIHEKTTLYYDSKDPKNAVLDLRFLQVHNLDCI